MDTGIQDAINLAWTLAQVVRGDSHESLLDSYSAEGQPVATGVVRATHLMTRMVTLANPITRALRNRLVPHVVALPGVLHRLMQGLSGLGVGYPDSPIVAEDWPRTPWFQPRSGMSQAPSPGERVPDLPLRMRRPMQGPARLHDFLRSTRSFLLLLLTGNPTLDAAFSPLMALVSSQYRSLIDVLAVTGGSTLPEVFHRSSHLTMTTSTSEGEFETDLRSFSFGPMAMSGIVPHPLTSIVSQPT